MHSHYRFIIQAAGIFLSYFYFGILQEQITRGSYQYKTINNDGESVYVSEKFTYPLTLVFILCLTNYLLVKLVLKLWPQEQDGTRTVYYASMAVTYLLAMVSSNMALQWVSYPTQVVGKSAKPIPIMILGVLIGRKMYPVKKYLFVTLIVVGVVLFMYKDKPNSSQHELSFGLGELLLLLSLTMDGLTGAVQERIRAESRPSGQQMMLAGNEWSTLFLSIAIILTGEIFKFIDFSTRYPMVITNLLLLGITQGIGQLFLYSMVSEFGPLMVSTVTTTRKFFTVLFSVIIFGNSLSTREWFGAVIVFTALFLDAYFSKSAPKKPTTTLK